MSLELSKPDMGSDITDYAWEVGFPRKKKKNTEENNRFLAAVTARPLKTHIVQQQINNNEFTTIHFNLIDTIIEYEQVHLCTSLHNLYMTLPNWWSTPQEDGK